jgi:hypothetical protein
VAKDDELAHALMVTLMQLSASDSAIALGLGKE